MEISAPAFFAPPPNPAIADIALRGRIKSSIDAVIADQPGENVGAEPTQPKVQIQPTSEVKQTNPLAVAVILVLALIILYKLTPS